MKTRAVRLYGESDLRLEEFDMGELKDDEILMELITDSVCMSTYKESIQGAKHQRVNDDISEHPIIVGHEFAGIIREVGAKWKDKYQVGTKYTMQMDFYKNKLAHHNIQCMIPDEDDIEYINKAIYTEFSKGIFLPGTKKQFLHIIDKLVDRGAEGVILGCTEIPILLKQEDCKVPVFDTTLLHATAAVDFALDEFGK